jgi:hypothetical protein
MSRLVLFDMCQMMMSHELHDYKGGLATSVKW